MALLSSQFTIISAQALPTVYVDPSTLVDLTLTAGTTFSIDIVVKDVIDLAGFTIILTYDTTVLTANNFSVYNPFTVAWPSNVNDTAGFVFVLYTLPFGTKPGVSGTQKLVKIDFTVDALGLSIFGFSDTSLMDTDGQPIVHDAVGGSFTNTRIHNLSIKSATASPTRVAAPGGIININVDLSNEGDFDEFFNVTARHSTNVWIENKTDEFLAINETRTITFAWDTTGLDIGEYTVTINVSLPTDNYKPDNTATLKTRIGVIRDIAVSAVNVSTTEAAEGESVIISATIDNLGNFTEDYTVVFRYDNTTIGSQAESSLLPGFHSTLSLSWDTTGLGGGKYAISAEAVVEMDDNRGNNLLVYGEVSIGGTLGTNTFLYVAIGIIVVVVVLVVLRYALKRRKRKPQ